MTPPAAQLARLRFLARVVAKECRHLQDTDRRLFSIPFDTARASSLDNDVELAERVEAFVGRFGRLQDTLADKFLPALLAALGETPGAQIDNLDRAERLQLVGSADAWFAARQLRNRMVHEYIDDPAVLAESLQAGHERVSLLLEAAHAMQGELKKRGWAE